MQKFPEMAGYWKKRVVTKSTIWTAEKYYFLKSNLIGPDITTLY